jgi:WD40 repeat protein
VHVSQTGTAHAAPGGNANTGYQHIDKLVLVQSPVTERQPPQAPRIPSWAIPRPDEQDKVVAAVCAKPGSMVGITTGLEGAGGFGKTMLAEMACADERVREHFAGRVYVVTLGQDVRGPSAIATKVIEAIHFITGHTATYTDPGMAGDELGRLLDQPPGRRTLLVLDDVWEPAQLDPFLRGGRDCVRLVTTRVPAVLPGDALRVRVDQMTQDQARAVLDQDLPPLPEHLASDLITVTGRWPLLLRLANRWMRRQVETGAGIAAAAADMLALLREEGPAAVDRSHPPPDPGDPVQRRRLVRATLQAAIGLLTTSERQCLAELGIFAEDEPVPILVAARLWQARTGLSEPRARDLCHELSSLSLLTVNPDAGGYLVLHDVIRDYLRHDLGSDRITALNAVLTDAVQDDLPPAAPLTASAPDPQAAWWTLAENSDSTPAAGYLADHAISHLLAADRAAQAEAVACDLRWVEARLRQRGPTAPWSDCARVPTSAAARRARDLAQTAHLLAPTDPAHALTAVLHSRLGSLPGWAEQVTARQPQLVYPVLRNHWPPPDLPHPALIRVLDAKDMDMDVSKLVVAADGSWLAAVGGYWSGRLRIWNLATGKQTATLAQGNGELTHMAVAAVGSRLATETSGTVLIWDPISGQQASTFRGSLSPSPIAVAPDGTWLATADGGKVRIWDTATGQQTASLPHIGGGEAKMAVAPDGSWLAVGGLDGTVRIWDPAAGQQTATLTGCKGRVARMAVAPDGSWLAITCGWDDQFRIWDQTLRIWDLSTSAQIGSLYAGGGEAKMAVAPDGTWLAVGGHDGTVRIWDPAAGQQTATLTGCKGKVTQMAVAPDGSWLAATDWDETWTNRVQIWDPATSAQIGTLTGHDIRVAAVAPDGTWLATTGGHDNETVRIWDPATSAQIGTLTGHNSGVSAVVVVAASDGIWLATAGRHDGAVRIWDPAAGQLTATAPEHTGKVTAMAIAPDGTWLATAASGKVRIWDPATGQQTAPLIGRESKVTHMVVASERTCLATIDNAGTIRIWDPATGQQTATFRVHDGSVMVTAMAIAPDGTWLATASGWDKTVRIWDAATGHQTATLPGHMGQVTAITIAPDGTWLASTDDGGGGTARIWHLASGQATRIRPFRMRDPAKLAIAPDSTWLATASGREEVRIWDAATGHQTATLPGNVPRRDTIAIAPDGTWLAVAGDHGTVPICDPATGAQIGTLTGHSEEVVAVAIGPDGTRLATIDSAGTIRIWDKATSRVLAMTRTDGAPFSCTWMPDGAGLVVTGEQGVHFYEFHPAAVPDA